MTSPSEFPLQREGGVFVIPIRLDGPKGKRVIRLALDTGATVTMVSTKAAIAIGIHPGRARQFREVITASGIVMIPIINIPRLSVFGRKVPAATVSCHDLPPESPIDGLLGLDLLIRLKAIIDLGKNCIRIP